MRLRKAAGEPLHVKELPDIDRGTSLAPNGRCVADFRVSKDAPYWGFPEARTAESGNIVRVCFSNMNFMSV